MKFLNDLKQFIIELKNEVEIPKEDKYIILGLLIYCFILRVFLIPDFIPYIGILDVLFCIALISDYFFEVLDQNILLKHYPWGLKSFASIRRFARFLTFFAPYVIKDLMWKYKKEVIK